MQYLLCNGSPRGTKGATSRIVDMLAKGIAEASALPSSEVNTSEANAIHVDSALLFRISEHADTAAAFAAADRAVIVFPLYTDSMPGLTMAFLEALEPYAGKLQHMSIAYVVQSGFPEKLHCEAVAKYLSRLTEILGAEYAGTAIFGNGMSLYGKRLDSIRQLAHGFAITGRFDPELLKKTTPMGKISPLLRGPIRILSRTPLLQFYWDRQLKANGVFKERFDKPYGV